MKMSRAFFVMALFCLTSAARADLTMVQKVEGAGRVTDMVIKIKGDKARVDPDPNITTIVDSKSGEVFTLLNERKKFLRIHSGQVKSVAEMALKGQSDKEPAEHPKLKATGRKEKILGYETEEYVCEAPSFKASYWISTSFPEAQAIMKQLQAMTTDFWKMAGRNMPDYRDFPGLPLRSQVNMSGQEITSTLVSLKQDSLDPAEFVVPADFVEMKMPGMPGGLRPAPTPGPNPAESPK